MAVTAIRFTDGAAYDRMMGVWSRMVGEVFLDWLAPAPGLVWADIGCGSGAFSALLAARCQPAKIHGIDPSEAQLSHARTGPAAQIAEYRQGDATALPYADNSVDAAVMALVLFFVPDPAKGVAEMTRVVKPGGTVSAYVWDIPGGGAPLEPINAELGPTGVAPALPPNGPISRKEALHEAWREAGLEQIESRVIRVRRSFAEFAEFWAISTSGPTMGPLIAALAPDVAASLQARVRARLLVGTDGTISYDAWANAIKGSKPDVT